MIINKIISLAIAITSVVVIPVQLIATFVLGILVTLTFGLFLIPFSIIWTVLFLGPLLGLSYLYERYWFMRPFAAFAGIPLAILADTYVALLPSMGEMESRYEKMIYCQTFPYSWRYNQFKFNKFNIAKNDVLAKILREVSQAQPLNKHLNTLRTDVYSRPEYISGKYEIDW